MREAEPESPAALTPAGAAPGIIGGGASPPPPPLATPLVEGTDPATDARGGVEFCISGGGAAVALHAQLGNSPPLATADPLACAR